MLKRSVAAVLVAKVIAYPKVLYVRKMGKAIKRIEVIAIYSTSNVCFLPMVLIFYTSHSTM